MENEPQHEATIIPLTETQIEYIAGVGRNAEGEFFDADGIFTFPDGDTVSKATTSPEDLAKIDQRAAELEAAAAEAAAQVPEEAQPEDEGDGYAFVDSVTYGEETKRIPVSALEEKVVVEFDESAQRGISATFDRGADPSHGTVIMRIIADHNSRAVLSRKDENGITYLRVQFAHQAV